MTDKSMVEGNNGIRILRNDLIDAGVRGKFYYSDRKGEVFSVDAIGYVWHGQLLDACCAFITEYALEGRGRSSGVKVHLAEIIGSIRAPDDVLTSRLSRDEFLKMNVQAN